MSVKESARMAQSNNFMGLMVQSQVLVSQLQSFDPGCQARGLWLGMSRFIADGMQEMVPALVDTVKELGLVLVADISDEKAEPSNSSTAGWSPMPEGVNGILKNNGILRFHDTIDM